MDDWTSPPGFPASVSWVEFWWTDVGVLGLVFTVVSVLYMFRALVAVWCAVREQTASWAGPRGQFAIWMLVATSLFAPGWMMFVVAGVAAEMVPPPVGETRELVADIIGAAILCGEFCFALAQMSLVIVWRRVRAAPAFVPRVDRRKGVEEWQRSRQPEPPTLPPSS